MCTCVFECVCDLYVQYVRFMCGERESIEREIEVRMFCEA